MHDLLIALIGAAATVLAAVLPALLRRKRRPGKGTSLGRLGPGSITTNRD